MVEVNEIIKEAKDEIDRGRFLKSEILIRDGCEKGWLATKEIIDRLLKEKTGKVFQSNHERRKALMELEEKYPNLKELGIKDRFMAREKSLHEVCFYDGQTDSVNIDDEIKKIEELKEDIEKENGKALLQN